VQSAVELRSSLGGDRVVLFNPFRVGLLILRLPRVGAARQPWAIVFNPVGVVRRWDSGGYPAESLGATGQK